jgi:uncharacterized protein
LQKLAIVGTGIAGLSAAYFLSQEYEIHLFEKNSYIGGHTNTVDILEEGISIPIDTGFIVYNEVTYPNLTRFFKEIKVETKNSSMSFSVQHIPSHLEFSGSGLNGLFAQRSNLFSPKYIKFLLQINRFNETAPQILDDPKFKNYTLKQYLDEFNYNEDILYKYLIPMSSAVWSTENDLMLSFPATTLIRFFLNHGFLGLSTQHQWKTVCNGSRSYVQKLLSLITPKINLNSSIQKIIRENNSVKLISENGKSEIFDKVLLATHADTSLRLLESPTDTEKKLLSPFKYQKNIATLHTDESVMPKKKLCWSSWNYRVEENNFPSTIYWMNSLQNVSQKKNYFVSINGENSIDPKKIIQKIVYEHPIFSVASSNAADSLQSLNETGPIYFSGSYFRYGFHEDAFSSGLNAAEKILRKKIWT